MISEVVHVTLAKRKKLAFGRSWTLRSLMGKYVTARPASEAASHCVSALLCGSPPNIPQPLRRPRPATSDQ